MNQTLAALDREWERLDRSAASAERLTAWSETEPALRGLDTLGAVLAARKNPIDAPAILSALARRAGDDELAARTLLQAVLPGLVRLASTCFADDPIAADELVSLAWERIRTYPTHREGSVAANVLWDVRKRYRQHRSIDVPASPACDDRGENDDSDGAKSPSAEDVALGRRAFDELVAAHRAGVISGEALRLILRTRWEQIPLEQAAAERNATTAQANCIRWRAERRLRPLLAMAS